jgi:isocitrate/isopropylmalate dehydrogenase
MNLYGVVLSDLAAEAAVARVYRDRKHLTRDQGGTATTRELGRAVLDALR